VSDPSAAFQAAIEAVLRADVAVKAAFGGTTRLYTLTGPVNAPFPHIVIGEDQIIGDDVPCGPASSIIVTVHVFAQEPTPAETRIKAKAIAAAVRAALTVQLAVTGHLVVDWQFEGARHLTDPDGLTAHAVLTFEYYTAPSA